MCALRYYNRIVGNLLKRSYAKQNAETVINSSKMKEEEEKRRANLMAKSLPKVKPIEGVKNIILVSSGKGGVGKSTTAVNLAIALKQLAGNDGREEEVGLLDTDIFGPSIPLMMNLDETPILNEKNLMEPLINYGVKCMSMGFLIESDAAIIWRGLMVMQALEKLLRQVHWNKIDYLIVDTPPGTGDTHLSLVQNIPITGVVLVTTPQTAAIQVTRRGANMYSKLGIPLIGLVENMSSMRCPACQCDVQLFGNGVAELADELEIDVLQRVPLEKDINGGSDRGIPITIAKPNSSEANIYKKLAANVHKFIKNNDKKINE